MDDDYYCDTEFHGKGATGRKLTPKGPQKPDTTSLGEVEAEQVLKKCRKERKKYTDGVALQKRKDVGLLVAVARERSVRYAYE